MSDLDDFLLKLPKIELHLHIEGTLEPELRFRLAERNNIELPYSSAAELRASYDFDDLPSFLTGYYDGMRVLRTEQDFYDLAWAYFEKAAGQNVRYTEIFFDPQAHTGRGVAFDTVIRGLRRAQLDGRRLLHLHVQLIMCFLRDYQPEFAMATLLESLPYREWIVGVGLDSDERGNPPRKFAEVFHRAREEGYLLTMHCDVDQENTTEHIRQCLHEIEVDRIDHGVNILTDPELLAEARRRRIGLTACPISNGWVSDGLKAPEIKRLLDAGLKVTVNSDDPAYFGGYVSENLAAVQRALELTRHDLVRLQRNAVESCWAPPAVKDRISAELDRLC
ncbi:adenosine deaminase [Saccharopolyspora phatthalungensis]|uniref:Adenine deaminase n=1 Tax=Saccharopolyspora phatthalungensis TaxID=664693 RepID=A0A840QEP5_9PSEU|nr:adenosine deaminase [Saccharopolyspora phatthalungensis]MBB5158497.1 adenosine deaminase [Saccharopolyspora phatthalungensis]